MPLISHNIILDEYIEDSSFVLLVGEDEKPLYCVLHEIDPLKNKKRSIIMGAFKSGGKSFIYKRASNIGTKGRINIKDYPNISKCVQEFMKEFKKLTENTWHGREDFKIRNNVILFSLGEKVEQESKIEEAKSPEIEINWRVSAFLELIGSDKCIKAALEDLNVDTTSSGKCEKDKDSIYIPDKNISQAKSLMYKYFVDLSENTEVNPARVTQIYYSLIPIIKKKIEVIKTQKDISDKLEELEVLENISFTISILSQETKIDRSLPQNDNLSRNLSIYSSLGYDITVPPIEEHNMIKKYFHNSKGSTHHFKLDLVHVLKVENKQKEFEYLEKFGKERRELLYHGSRTVNWVSILKRGLLLDPSSVGAVITGKMFGNGIYWANSVSKSAQYCGAGGYRQYGSKEHIVLALADVALGRQEKKYHGCHPNRKDYDTMYGIGKYSFKNYYEMLPGLYVPNCDLTHKNPNAGLFYDEKIIYEADRYLFRYIIICDYHN